VERYGEISVSFLTASHASAVAEVWQTLEAQFGQGQLKCSWDWTRTWLEHYGDVIPHRFMIAERPEGPCGVALLTERIRRVGTVRIRRLYLGTISDRPTAIVEFTRLLAAPQHLPAISSTLVAELCRGSNWYEFVLNGVPLDEAVHFLSTSPFFDVRAALCRVVDLNAVRTAGKEVVQVLRASTRQKIRRSLRGFDRLETEWGDDPDHALDILDELIVLHQSRWMKVGQPGSFSGTRFAAFHRTVVPRLVLRGAAILLRVRAGGKTVGCLYVLIDKGRALSYLSGLNSFEDNRLKPGMVVDAICMQECLERGLHEYDFMAGDSRFKREMSTGERGLIWGTLRSPHIRWLPIAAGGAIKKRLQRTRV
jgi:CelD/BcsL family acetyltransferase involved in cellulose biosynthesis